MWEWSRGDISDGMNTSTATRVHMVTEDTVIVTSGPYEEPICGGGLTSALNRSTGEPIWTIPKAWAVTKAAIEDDMIFMPFHCGDVVAMKAASGEPVWSRSWSARIPLTIASSSVVVKVHPVIVVSSVHQ